jgi:predicted nucleic acid-binding protein
MKVVTNSIPLIAPSKINRLELLREVHRSIYIPEEVYTEVVVNYLTIFASMEHESAIDSITKHSQPKESNHKDVKRINSNRSKTMEFLRCSPL